MTRRGARRVRAAVRRPGACRADARPTADPPLRIATLDVMTFDDAGLVTSRCAYWSAETMVRA